MFSRLAAGGYGGADVLQLLLGAAGGFVPEVAAQAEGGDTARGESAGYEAVGRAHPAVEGEHAAEVGGAAEARDLLRHGLGLLRAAQARAEGLQPGGGQGPGAQGGGGNLAPQKDGAAMRRTPPCRSRASTQGWRKGV